MIRRAVLTATAVLLLSTATVNAATASIDVVNFAFQPANPTIRIGDSALWTRNSGNTTHTVTPNVPAVWPFSGGTLGKDGAKMSAAFLRAGTFPYHCAIHPSQMQGSIKVKMSVSPTSGTTLTNFTIRVANQNAQSGFIQDVQRRRHGGSFAAWMTTTGQLVVFNPTSSQTGIWEFRSRYRKTSTGEHTNWSPVLSLTVNN
jgi:plastocyanin